MEVKRGSGFSFFLWNAAGLMVILFSGARFAWGVWNFASPAPGVPSQSEVFRFVTLIVFFYGLAVFLAWKYLRYPRVGRFSCLFLCSASVWTTAVFCVAMFRLYYSRPFLLLAIFLQLILTFAGYRLFLDHRRLRFAVVRGGVADCLLAMPLCQWEVLDLPILPEGRVDGLVVDLHKKELAPEWIRFIAECSLTGVQLFHAATLYENLTGRVSLDHMGKDLLGEMAAPRFYSFIKRFFDLALVLLSAFFWLPLICAVSLLVLCCMGRPVFFRQERIGRFGRPFSILKMRSLESDGSATCLGRFLRRHRLDELPQLLNVLTGDMSLVGPRPEQTPLVAKYEEAIPFYTFRAALRPGLTGWAQVCWRYANDTEENRIKLEYDFFYLKNFSFWLDLLILAKTVETVFFGEGSGEHRP